VSELDNIGDRLLVVFDGNCGLCNGWVRWVIRRDRGDRLRFAASSWPAVAELMAGYGAVAEAGDGPTTIVVFRGPIQARQAALVRSAAVRAVLGELHGVWPVVARILGWVPRFIADAVYNLVARWRYRIWGRLESCPIPTAEERKRFLENAVYPSKSC
jgi:predicted DCC family thiol-disulfide oxidoreductase YuxK